MPTITNLTRNPDGTLTVTVASEMTLTLPAAEWSEVRGNRRHTKAKSQLLSAIKQAVKKAVKL